MKISVITVSYNAERTIEGTIRSVVGQDYINTEHIVVDGGSNDGTEDILKEFSSRIDRWISEEDDGIYHAMNKGLRMASGEFVGFLNADDEFAASDSLSAIARTAIETGAACVFGDTLIMSAKQPSRIGRYYSARRFRPWQFRFGHMPPHPSTYIKRELLLRLNGFDTSFSISADFDLMLRLFREINPSCAYLPKTLVNMRGGGVTTRGFRSNVSVNRELLASCRKRGVWTHPLLIWFKYLAKVYQYISRPPPLRRGVGVD